MSEYDNELERIVAELNRAAAPVAQPGADWRPTTSSVDQMLAYAVQRGASDLLIIAGAPVTLRVNGVITPSGPPLSAEDSRNLLIPLLTKKQAEEFQQAKSLDFCFTRESLGRFRANIHHQRETIAGSIRLLPNQIPSLESLHLPPVLARLAERRQGLILVTGPTGCGKVPHWRR